MKWKWLSRSLRSEWEVCSMSISHYYFHIYMFNTVLVSTSNCIAARCKELSLCAREQRLTTISIPSTSPSPTQHHSSVEMHAVMKDALQNVHDKRYAFNLQVFTGFYFSSWVLVRVFLLTKSLNQIICEMCDRHLFSAWQIFWIMATLLPFCCHKK